MRAPIPLVVITALACAPIANAQTAGTTPRAATQVTQIQSSHSARRPHVKHPSARRATAQSHADSPAVKSDSLLSLGATDITGNKELPKVMVIVPWKDSLGAGGVVKPTDSLLDEVLQPVDRGVFQRRIRYYGQLDSGGRQAAAADSENRVSKPGMPPGAVAPVGDSH